VQFVSLFPLTCRGIGVGSPNISTGDAAMNSEHQDGKTEPASKATVWDFGLGKGSIGLANDNE